MDIDYNQKKSSGVSIGKLKHLEELMTIYGPLNAQGYPDKVTSISVSYYTKEVEVRRQAIENISGYIKRHFEVIDFDKLRKEKTSVLQSISSIIETARKKAEKIRSPISLTEEENNIVMSYAVKEKEENYCVNANDDEESYDEEEFFSDEELLIAYGEEGPNTLSKRLGTNIIKTS